MDNDVQIVTAAVIEKGGKVLIARRKPGGYQGGKWELPGGKLEPGETPQECLRRELYEELGIEANIGDFIAASRFQINCVFTIELRAYRVTHLSGDFVLNDHVEIAWVEPQRLRNYEFPPADKPIIEILVNRVQ